MKKEEILERSRNEKRDEGKEFTFDSGRKFGAVGMLIIFSFLGFYNLYHNLRETNYALLAMFFGYLGCESIGIYHITRKTKDFINIIVACLLSICFMILYLIR